MKGPGLVSVCVCVCVCVCAWCVSGRSVEPCWSVGHPFDAEAPLRGEGDQRTCVRLGPQQKKLTKIEDSEFVLLRMTFYCGRSEERGLDV